MTSTHKLHRIVVLIATPFIDFIKNMLKPFR